jgi:hypothetical protein
MSSRLLVGLAGILATLTAGCSFGSFQTAHTQAPATLSVTPGVTLVSNGIDDQAGRNVTTNVSGQIAGRVGVSRRVDVGIGSFMRSGMKADVKVNVLDPKGRLALAPRVGAGYRLGDRSMALLEAGAITSYRVGGWFEPYAGLTYANHWISPRPLDAPAGDDVVRRRGSGDGLLQLSLGVELALSQDFAILGEYGHWFPLNDDPGDFYRFVATDIVGLALRIGRRQP